MKRILKMAGLCVICITLWAGFGFTRTIAINEDGDIIQETTDGAINWSRGIISAVGYASPEQDAYAQRVAAAAGARANLLMVLKQMNIKRGISVEKGRLYGDINIQKIEGLLQGSFLGDFKHQPDGTPSISAYKTLTPELIRELLPAGYFAAENGETRYAPGASDALPASPDKAYTGLVIDAAGLGVVPSLGFSVTVDGTRETLYGISMVSRPMVIERKGMAGYACSLEEAVKQARAGDHPLIVKATATSGQRKTDLSVSKKDAAAIYQANLEAGFLNDLKVVVVCGE